MRVLLSFMVLLPVHGCHGGAMSGRDTDGFDSEQAGYTDPCAGQTSPSPQCPGETDESTRTPEANGSATPTTPPTAPPSTTPAGNSTHGPVYTNGKLEMRLHPHRIKKNTESELTLTFTAVMALRKRAETQYGQRTHDVYVGAQQREVISTYRVSSLTARRYFKDDEEPVCHTVLAQSCALKIVSMEKGDSFELKLIVKASAAFNLGVRHDNDPGLRKKPGGLHNKPPLIEVDN